jgi:DNA repair protein RecO (recombination protein O)
MLHKTRGIVFRFTKYGDTSIIVNIFTELFGLQAYIVNGVRNKTARSKIALYQPLTLLDLVVYHRENANINRIKEIKCIHPFQTLATDIKKSAIGMFIIEIVNKTVKEESHAKEIFEFLFTSLVKLDVMQGRYENFHLVFLVKLSRYLGFGAHNVQEITGSRVVDVDIENLLKILLTAEHEDDLLISATQRRVTLEQLLKFFNDHIDTLGELKSIQILREVLS